MTFSLITSMCLIATFGSIQADIIPIPITGVGITVGLNNGTCPGSTCSWQRCRGNKIPSNAVIGGYTSSVQTLYVGRIDNFKCKEGVYPFLPCQVPINTVKGVAAVDGSEMSSPNIEVLIGIVYKWVKIDYKKPVIPETAIVGGTDVVKANLLFIGRIKYQNKNLVIGRFTIDFKLIVTISGEVNTFFATDSTIEIEILVAICTPGSSGTTNSLPTSSGNTGSSPSSPSSPSSGQPGSTPSGPSSGQPGSTPSGPSSPSSGQPGSTPSGPSSPSSGQPGSTPSGPSSPSSGQPGSTPSGPSSPSSGHSGPPSSGPTSPSGGHPGWTHYTKTTKGW